MKDLKSVKETLKTFREINEKEKISEITVKSVVMTLQTLDQKYYNEMIEEILPLIKSLDANIQIKTYLMMMEREMEEKKI